VQSTVWISLIKHYLVDVVPCNGPSMLPTIHEQDYLLANPLSIHLKRLLGDQMLGLAKGDVVIATSPENPDKTVCKRIMGMPGDQVREGNPLFYSIREPKYMPVPRGHVWLLGDNPDNSNDSRMYGPVPLGLVHKKVVASLKLPPNGPTLIPSDPDYAYPNGTDVTNSRTERIRKANQAAFAKYVTPDVPVKTDEGRVGAPPEPLATKIDVPLTPPAAHSSAANTDTDTDIILAPPHPIAVAVNAAVGTDTEKEAAPVATLPPLPAIPQHPKSETTETPSLATTAASPPTLPPTPTPTSSSTPTEATDAAPAPTTADSPTPTPPVIITTLTSAPPESTPASPSSPPSFISEATPSLAPPQDPQLTKKELTTTPTTHAGVTSEPQPSSPLLAKHAFSHLLVVPLTVAEVSAAAKSLASKSAPHNSARLHALRAKVAASTRIADGFELDAATTEPNDE
jgi:inner membrane protease subunit 1